MIDVGESVRLHPTRLGIQSVNNDLIEIRDLKRHILWRGRLTQS